MINSSLQGVTRRVPGIFLGIPVPTAELVVIGEVFYSSGLLLNYVMV